MRDRAEPLESTTTHVAMDGEPATPSTTSAPLCGRLDRRRRGRVVHDRVRELGRRVRRAAASRSHERGCDPGGGGSGRCRVQRRCCRVGLPQQSRDLHARPLLVCVGAADGTARQWARPSFDPAPCPPPRSHLNHPGHSTPHCACLYSGDSDGDGRGDCEGICAFGRHSETTCDAASGDYSRLCPCEPISPRPPPPPPLPPGRTPCQTSSDCAWPQSYCE